MKRIALALGTVVVVMACGTSGSTSPSPTPSAGQLQPASIKVSLPGLKVACPATPYDAKGLLIQSIRDKDPVIFCEHKLLYGLKGDVPEAC